MITGNGVKINSEPITDITKIIDLNQETIVQFGKNRFKKVTCL